MGVLTSKQANGWVGSRDGVEGAVTSSLFSVLVVIGKKPLSRQEVGVGGVSELSAG